MGYPELDENFKIDPRTRGLIALAFCEHNLVVPLKLDGAKLTIAAADPDSLEVSTAINTLRPRYEIELISAKESEVRAVIAGNYYSRCIWCGRQIVRGRTACRWCSLDVMRQTQGVGPQPQQAVAPPPAGNATSGGPEPEVAAAEIVGKTCPYCQFPIKDGAPIFICPSCGIPHHEECWRDNGGCTTFGCSGAHSVSPQMTAPARYAQPAAVEYPQYQNRYRTIDEIRDYLVEAVLVTLLCWPLGIVAIIYAAQARSKKSAGDYHGAVAASNSAKSFVSLALVGMLLYVLFRLLLGIGSAGY